MITLLNNGWIMFAYRRLWKVCGERNQRNNPVKQKIPVKKNEHQVNRVVRVPHSNIYVFIQQVEDDTDVINVRMMSPDLGLEEAKARRVSIEIHRCV